MDGKHSKFIAGALIGLGVGLLLGSNEGKDKLKVSLSNLVDSIKNIDLEKIKTIFIDRLNEIKDELSGLDDDTKKELVKIKINKIKETCLELEDIAQENKIYRLEEVVTEIKEKADSILEEINSNKKMVIVKKKVTNAGKKSLTRKSVTKKTVSRKVKKN